jgi:uncharacterized zinc-type alcohol dehydrogenase-like protein
MSTVTELHDETILAAPRTSHQAWVTRAAKQAMTLETVDLGPLGAEDVEAAVEHCGLCHSDLSILNNYRGISQYPAIRGHEVVGRVTAAGPNAKGLKVGQRVGVCWNSGSFLQYADAGPLLCGGVTVFAPLPMYVEPTQRAGIIGIGGPGHMAVKFAAAFGCDVTAFTSSESKFDEAARLGANHAASTSDSARIGKLAGSFDLPISTVNVKLQWDSIIGTLGPNGRLHVVGAVPEPIPVGAFSLIVQQRNVSGSPSGSPVAIGAMLDFAARQKIAPETEHFPMSNINEAFARLESGKAHDRIVLEGGF